MAVWPLAHEQYEDEDAEPQDDGDGSQNEPQPGQPLAGVIAVMQAPQRVDAQDDRGDADKGDEAEQSAYQGGRRAGVAAGAGCRVAGAGEDFCWVEVLGAGEDESDREPVGVLLRAR